MTAVTISLDTETTGLGDGLCGRRLHVPWQVGIVVLTGAKGPTHHCDCWDDDGLPCCRCGTNLGHEDAAGTPLCPGFEGTWQWQPHIDPEPEAAAINGWPEDGVVKPLTPSDEVGDLMAALEDSLLGKDSSSHRRAVEDLARFLRDLYDEGGPIRVTQKQAHFDISMLWRAFDHHGVVSADCGACGGRGHFIDPLSLDEELCSVCAGSGVHRGLPDDLFHHRTAQLDTRVLLDRAREYQQDNDNHLPAPWVEVEALFTDGLTPHRALDDARYAARVWRWCRDHDLLDDDVTS